MDYRAYEAVFDTKKYPLKKSSMPISGIGEKPVMNMGSVNLRLFINGKIIMIPCLVCDLQSNVTDILLSQRYLSSIFDRNTICLRTKQQERTCEFSYIDSNGNDETEKLAVIYPEFKNSPDEQSIILNFNNFSNVYSKVKIILIITGNCLYFMSVYMYLDFFFRNI